MLRLRMAALALPLALVLGGCADDPVAPDAAGHAEEVALRPVNGTGLVLDDFTEVTLPLIGLPLLTVDITQANIVDLGLVEDLAGQIIGLEAEGVVQLTGGVLGSTVLNQAFEGTVGITSSGPGQCELISIDIGEIPVDLTALGLGIVSVDVSEASLTGRGSGALGSLLCNLGSLLGGLGGGGGAIPGAEGLVNAINNRI